MAVDRSVAGIRNHFLGGGGGGGSPPAPERREWDLLLLIRTAPQ